MVKNSLDAMMEVPSLHIQFSEKEYFSCSYDLLLAGLKLQNNDTTSLTTIPHSHAHAITCRWEPGNETRYCKHILVPETRFYVLYRAGAPHEATQACAHTLPGAQLRTVQDNGSK